MEFYIIALETGQMPILKVCWKDITIYIYGAAINAFRALPVPIPVLRSRAKLFR